jgi:hypothetical protein
MITLNITIQRNWHVRTPAVVRYMDQPFIDQFFQDGTIRLSSFAAFAKHRDELRLDGDEGRNYLVGRSVSGQTVTAVTSHGHRSLVLCGSTIESDQLRLAFKSSGFFRIRDTTAFATAIALALPNFVEGIEGCCIYHNERMIERTVDPLDLAKLKTDPNSLNTIHQHLGQIGGPDVYFTKPGRYAPQSEYRFVWILASEIGEFVEVRAPDAVQFCERPS